MDLKALQSYIDECKLCIELGGPTPDGYQYIKSLGLRIPQSIVITNISNPITLNPFGDNPQTYPVDEIVDISELPYRSDSIDLFLVSSFPRKLRPTLLQKTINALRPGGILIFENVLPEDDILAKQCGFLPLLDSNALANHFTQVYQKI